MTCGVRFLNFKQLSEIDRARDSAFSIGDSREKPLCRYSIQAKSFYSAFSFLEMNAPEFHYSISEIGSACSVNQSH